MDKLSWTKYFFGIWIVAVLISLVAKYLTANVLVLVPLSLALYWLSVKGMARINGYE
jgi:hypothetical protein